MNHNSLHIQTKLQQWVLWQEKWVNSNNCVSWHVLIYRTIHLAFFPSKNNGHNVCEDLESEEQASIRLAFPSARPPTRDFGNIMVGQILTKSIVPFTSNICTCFDFTGILNNDFYSFISFWKPKNYKEACFFLFSKYRRKHAYIYISHWQLNQYFTFHLAGGRKLF